MNAVSLDQIKQPRGAVGTKNLKNAWQKLEQRLFRMQPFPKKVNPDPLANAAAVNSKVINARKLYYHRSCFTSYTKKEKKPKENKDVVAFQLIIEHEEQKVFWTQDSMGSWTVGLLSEYPQQGTNYVYRYMWHKNALFQNTEGLWAKSLWVEFTEQLLRFLH